MALLEYPSLNLTEQSFQAILIVLEKLPQIDPFFLILGTLSIIWSMYKYSLSATKTIHSSVNFLKNLMRKKCHPVLLLLLLEGRYPLF